jgi:hypothetical protein
MGEDMKKLPLLLFLVVALVFFIYAQETSSKQHKKLIEWGFDMPTPEYLRDNIQSMEEQPFDGLVFRLRKWPAYSAFETTSLSKSEMKLDVLSSIAWGKFDSNFLHLWATNTSGMDWFNDAHWETITSNLKLYVKAVNAAHAKGIVFDIEPYEKFGKNPWRFWTKEQQELYPGQTLREVEAKVRERGAQFMNTLQSEKPDITLLCALLLGTYRNEAEHYFINTPERRTYALLPAFVNGMLDVIGPEVVIVDGRMTYQNLSGSYYFDDTRKFEFARDYVRGAREFISPENQEKYDKQVQVGQTAFADYIFGLLPANSLDGQLPNYYGTLSNKYMKQWWEHNIYQALATTDEYVYMYNEHMSWWGPEANPNYPELVLDVREGIEHAREKFFNNQPLGFSMVKPDEVLWDKNQHGEFVAE